MLTAANYRRALDRSERRLDPDLVTTVGRWFDTVENEWREGGDIGPLAEVSADADGRARLLVRFGRTS